MDLSVLLDADAETAARLLIGASIFRDGVGGVIVETEAYDEDDPASHAYGGLRNRNRTLFKPGGHLYVYRSYGLHWCMNVTCGPAGYGSGALIRALEPTQGVDLMAGRRGISDPRRLASGPGRATEALGVTGADDGAALDRAPFRLALREAEPPIVAGPRIGISRAAERRRRFGLAGSPYLSRPFPAP